MEQEKNQVLIQENKDVSKSQEIKQTTKKEVVKKEQKKPVKLKLFFKQNDKILISVDAYHSKDTGQFAFSALTQNNPVSNNDQIDSLYTKVNYKFWFTRCTYDKLNRYRTKSMIYNSEDQNNTINKLRLREFFLIWHLVDWNLTDEDGNKIQLKFDPNKALSDDTLELIYTLPASLMDVVLNAYQQKISV